MATNQTDQSLVHREMARRSQDVHRVKNPRNEDYKLAWDSFVDTIPANSASDLPTYKVDKYLREMSALIIRERIQEEVDRENKRRRDRGEKEMEKWTGEAQHVLESKVATELNNPENLMKLYQELYVGLVKEYGIEKVQKEVSEVVPTTHEQIMGKLLGSRPRVVDSGPPILQKTRDDATKTPLEQMTQFQLRKVAKEKGIPTKKTSKKDELITKISQA